MVTQKVVSKAEGRIVPIDPDDPEAKRGWSSRESVRVLRRRGDLLITETRHGFVCANAGVDLSNVEAGTAALLPVDPDRSARRIREALGHRLGVDLAVVISDTFGRTWRNGVTDVAIGIAGIAGVVDLRGTPDATGRVLEATEVCVADEVAGAAELVMGKDRSVPAAVVRGVDPSWLRPAFGRRRDRPRTRPATCSAERPTVRGGPDPAAGVGWRGQPTSKRSTTNTRVSFGPMTPPAPRLP